MNLGNDFWSPFARSDTQILKSEVMPALKNSQKSVTGLLYDFFLSYRHLDNTVLSGAPADKTKGEMGWVDDLEKFLRYRVAFYLRRETRPWLDTNNIRRHEQLTDDIRSGIRGSRLFLPVLSPNYLAADSRFVPQEFDEFVRKAKRDISGVDRRKRLFKIMRAAVPPDQIPALLRDSLGFEFFHRSTDPALHGMPIEPRRGDADQRAFLAIAERLAREISDRLVTIEDSVRPRLGALYLGTCSDDVDAASGPFRTELKGAGYEVLPTAAPPLHAKAFDQFVSNHLDRCRTSVHLLGEEEGALLSDNTPAHHRDFELALKRCREGKLQMFVWLQPGLEPDGRQKAFLETVASVDLEGFELLDQDFSDLLDAVRQRFRDFEAREKALSAALIRPELADEEHQAFLLHDLIDHGEGHLPAIEHVLRANLRCGSVQPIFAGTPATRRRYHDACIAAAEIVIFYWGTNTPEAAAQQDLELPGLLRPAGKSLLYYLGPPETEAKRRFIPSWGSVVRDFGAFDAQVLESAVAALLPATERNEL